MKKIITLWRFSRPHTVIGTIISIVTLFLILSTSFKAENFPLMMMAIIIGVSCNFFIVGINQIADVDIDKINKPYLPIAAGELSVKTAYFIIFTFLSVGLILALYLSTYLFLIILTAAAIGWAYSMSPFYFKKHLLCLWEKGIRLTTIV